MDRQPSSASSAHTAGRLRLRAIIAATGSRAASISRMVATWSTTFVPGLVTGRRCSHSSASRSSFVIAAPMTPKEVQHWPAGKSWGGRWLVSGSPRSRSWCAPELQQRELAAEGLAGEAVNHGATVRASGDRSAGHSTPDHAIPPHRTSGTGPRPDLARNWLGRRCRPIEHPTYLPMCGKSHLCPGKPATVAAAVWRQYRAMRWSADMFVVRSGQGPDHGSLSG